jgi:glutathione S-transferase
LKFLRVVLNFQVDIAYAPFIDRFQHFALDVKKYDITAGRPKLAAWIEV